MSIKKFCVITLNITVAIAGLYMVFWGMTNVNAAEARSVCSQGIEITESEPDQYLRAACEELTNYGTALKEQYKGNDDAVRILVLQHMTVIEQAINQPHVRHHIYFGIPGELIPVRSVEEIKVGVRELLVDDPSGIPLPKKLAVYDTKTDTLTRYPE